MKHIILLVGIFISISNLYSQNPIDPPALPIDFSDTTVFDRNWEQSNFIRGWNWGDKGRKLDEAMNINTKISFIPEH